MVVANAILSTALAEMCAWEKTKVMNKNSFTPDLFKQWISFEKNRVHEYILETTDLHKKEIRFMALS